VFDEVVLKFSVQRYKKRFYKNVIDEILIRIMMGEQMKKGNITELSSYAQLKVSVNLCI
jgi:hypothetical protein